MTKLKLKKDTNYQYWCSPPNKTIYGKRMLLISDSVHRYRPLCSASIQMQNNHSQLPEQQPDTARHCMSWRSTWGNSSRWLGQHEGMFEVYDANYRFWTCQQKGNTTWLIWKQNKNQQKKADETQCKSLIPSPFYSGQAFDQEWG